jgi:hypothetical protein
MIHEVYTYRYWIGISHASVRRHIFKRHVLYRNLTLSIKITVAELHHFNDDQAIQVKI